MYNAILLAKDRDMNSAKYEGKKPLIILSAIMTVLNTIIILNLALADDFAFFLGFLIMGITIGSWISTINGFVVLSVASIVGIAISMLIVPSPITLIKVLAPIPFAVSLRSVLKSKIKRSTAIAISSSLFTITICTYFSFHAYITQGALSPKTIIDSFPLFFNELTELICESSQIKVAGELVQSITPEGAQKYLVAFVGIMPGIIFFLISIIGYIGAWLFKKSIKLTTGLYLSNPSWSLKIAFPTAIAFVIALFVAALSSSLSPLTLAALNICIIFFPTLFITGLNSAFEPKIVNGYKFPRLLRPAILLILILYNVYYFCFACAFFAIFDSIKSIIPKRKNEE